MKRTSIILAAVFALLTAMPADAASVLDVVLDLARELVSRAGATVLGEETAPAPAGLSKAELYALGLSGQKDSAAKRAALQKKLGLPERLSADALLDVLNALYAPGELKDLLAEALLEAGGGQHADEQDGGGSPEQV